MIPEQVLKKIEEVNKLLSPEEQAFINIFCNTSNDIDNCHELIRTDMVNTCKTLSGQGHQERMAILMKYLESKTPTPINKLVVIDGTVRIGNLTITGLPPSMEGAKTVDGVNWTSSKNEPLSDSESSLLRND